VNLSSRQKETEACFSEPEAAVACFFNSLFGHVRNWPRAYSCLAPAARGKFDSERGLLSFADYWEDKLSFLEEIVKKRHAEYPYSHRSCFSLDRVRPEEVSAGRAVIAIELVENHVAPERLLVLQTKELSRHGRGWLLNSGELDGNLNEIIVPRNPRRRSASPGSAGQG
jgi:hypothetical protein